MFGAQRMAPVRRHRRLNRWRGNGDRARRGEAAIALYGAAPPRRAAIRSVAMAPARGAGRAPGDAGRIARGGLRWGHAIPATWRRHDSFRARFAPNTPAPGPGWAQRGEAAIALHGASPLGCPATCSVAMAPARGAGRAPGDAGRIARGRLRRGRAIPAMWRRHDSCPASGVTGGEAGASRLWRPGPAPAPGRALQGEAAIALHGASPPNRAATCSVAMAPARGAGRAPGDAGRIARGRLRQGARHPGDVQTAAQLPCPFRTQHPGARPGAGTARRSRYRALWCIPAGLARHLRRCRGARPWGGAGAGRCWSHRPRRV
jgi:hypothetical protein